MGERPFDPAHPTLVHFYRAVVSHSDVWRQRMDATTNWAAATTAGMVTFAFGNREASHFVLLLALGFDTIFLLMESRRYQIYDLWRRRFRTLNQYLIAPVLSAEPVDDALVAERLSSVAADLGTTVPHLRLSDAIGFRLRRNYGYLFGVLLVAWVAKLAMHPTDAAGLSDVIARASLAGLPGAAVVALLASFLGVCIVLGLRASTEEMIRWTDVPSPASRWMARSRTWFPGSERRPDADGS